VQRASGRVEGRAQTVRIPPSRPFQKSPSHGVVARGSPDKIRLFSLVPVPSLGSLATLMPKWRDRRRRHTFHVGDGCHPSRCRPDRSLLRSYSGPRPYYGLTDKSASRYVFRGDSCSRRFVVQLINLRCTSRERTSGMKKNYCIMRKDLLSYLNEFREFTEGKIPIPTEN
jgi:hypothetical protein